jgi:mono/diheme cytochrome c family protein
MKRFVLALALTIVTAAPALPEQPPIPIGNVARGKTLYGDVGCYACHGLAGQGAQATGPRLSRTQLPFVAFLSVLRHPLNQMPPYESAVLPDQDVADIFAYMQQLPAPRDPNSIPLLR